MSRSPRSTTRLVLRRRIPQVVITTVVTGALVVVGATTAFAATLPTGPSATGLTGSRPNATSLSFGVDDRVRATVDVGTGNLNIADSLLGLPGITGQAPIGLAFNSLDTTGGGGAGAAMSGPGWMWSLDGAGSLAMQSDGSTIDYITGDGAVWPFTQKSGIYTSPAGLKAMLTKSGTNGTYKMQFEGNSYITFSASGAATSVVDKNGNTTAITVSSGTAATVKSTAGPDVSASNSARVANLSYVQGTSGGYPTYTTTVSQNSGPLARSVTVTQASNGQITAVTDATGATTTYAYSSGLVSKITNPLGATTSITYDSSKRVTEIDQSNTTTGSAGTSTTRLSYPSSTQTLVAGPDTSTSQAVSAVAHATFTIDGNHMVTAETDAANRQHASTFTTAGLDVGSSTTGSGTGGSGSTASISTSYSYVDNSGLSLNGALGASGNSSKATYANQSSTPFSSVKQYLPSTSTADSNITSGSMTSTYGYDNLGNMTSVTGNTAPGDSSSTDATSVTSSTTLNSDGTVATATAPGNGTNSTSYSYSYGQLSKVTPVTGSSLGVKQYTYDALGRLHTQTDGAGNTTTYGYDLNDRLLTTAFSDSTGTVTNTYDKAGDLTKQVSDGGTITDSYDQLGQLISTANTSSGGTIAFGYDAAGNQKTLTDSRGTTTEAFDAAGTLQSTTYPKGSGTAATYFATNSNGQHTDSWLQSNAPASPGTAPTVWAAHVHTSYDASGRVSEVLAELGPATATTTQMDVTYCYSTTNAAGGSCGTATRGDPSKLQATYNKVTGQETVFSYDGMGRLKKVTESGGNNGNDTYAYVYDTRGNRTSAVVTGTDPSSQTLTYNAANQISSTGYSYDGAGNLTATPTGTYTYNAAEQMTSSTVSGTTYSYTYAGAAQNAVLTETATGKSYKIAYGRSDSNGNPEIEQYNVNGNIAYVEQDPATGQATMLHTSSDIAALYVYDGTGNPVGLMTDFHTTSFQYAYDPYGLAILQQSSGGNGVGQNPYAFKSGVQDRATGFVKFGQRWYNPATGTWTQQDTLDAPLSIADGNRYAYAGDDPVNNVDPSGAASALEIIGDCLVHAAISAIFGLLEGPVGAAYDAILGCGVSIAVDVLRNDGDDGLADDLEKGSEIEEAVSLLLNLAEAVE